MSFHNLLKNTGDFIRPLYYEFVTILQNVKTSYKSALTDLKPQSLCVLSYSVGWITGLFVLRMKSPHSVVRFHAWQSIITSAIVTIALATPLVVMKNVTITSFPLAWSLLILYWLLIAFACFLWALLMYKSSQCRFYKLFIAGNMALNLSMAGNKNRLAAAPLKEAPALLECPGVKQQIPLEFVASAGIWREVVNSIAALYRNRDPYTALHQERVAQLACAIAGEMKLEKHRVEGIHIMGVIHDIGKIAVPGEILSKSGKLNDYELGIIKTHPEVAFGILKGLQFPWPVARAILQHHERLDGSGYPAGISGDELLLETRILSVSDVVEAMATHRPYRPAVGIKEAMDEITSKSGILYDPDVVDACVRLFTRGVFSWEEDGTKISVNVPAGLPISVMEQ